jgi:[acyl-carrier-protein] S-malonyltransferase
MKLAVLCGGQGELSAPMFDRAEQRPEAAALLRQAAALLGRDPRDLVHNADRDTVLTNRVSQLLSVTATLTTHACIAAALPAEIVITGYSVGEMGAWAIAGVWGAGEALRLTDRRARAMDAADGDRGQLGYVRGLGREAVAALCDRHHCTIAIINPGRLFLVGGERADIDAFCSEARSSGATKAAPLDVRVASHTPRLAQAVAPFRAELESAAVTDPAPGRILVAGGAGERIFRASDALAGLAARVAHCIDWAATLESLQEIGVDHTLDLGPGHGLADLARVALPGVRHYAADEFRSLEGLRAWLARG